MALSRTAPSGVRPIGPIVYRPGSMTTPPPSLSKKGQNAYSTFMSILESYGFTKNAGIAKTIRNAIQNGVTDAQQLQMIVSQTAAWKQRFAGNQIRIQRGLNALSVSDYLTLENQYTQIMHNAGLPDNFYDTHADLAKFIGNDVSPSELQSRVAMASDVAQREDPNVKAELEARGLGAGDMTAYFLDPTKALPILQQKYQSALVGAAGDKYGFKNTTAYDTKLVQEGISESQAMQGFSQARQMSNELHDLSSIYGIQYGDSEAEAQVFEGDAQATRNANRLMSDEKSAFSGSSGVGQINKDAAGAF